MARVLVRDKPQMNRDLVTAFALLGGFFLALVTGAYLYRLDWGGPFPRDGSSLVVGRDFLNFWMYGRAAVLPEPGRWYDVIAYQQELASLLGGGYPGQNWSYPPTVMLVAAPFGQFGYLPALAAWTLLGLALFVPVAWRQLADRRAMIALMCSPAAIFCLISGQSALIMTAMLIGIFALLDRRPLIAGVLIGLFTIKPQLGLLFPFLLIASRRWKVFAAAAVTALALAGLATLLFGPQAWVEFIARGLPTQNLVLADPERIATPFYPTVFMNLRGIGIGYEAAMAVQALFAFGAAGALFWAFRFRADAEPRLLFALFAACAVTAVPYVLAYDTLPLTFAALALAAGSMLDRRGRLLARMVYWLPLLQIGFGMLHIPGPALIAPAFAVYLTMQLRAGSTDLDTTGKGYSA